MLQNGNQKTAFVLAGGGSLGAVQVGMLKALAKQHIVPDFVVGASVGAINSAYYAAEPNEERCAGGNSHRPNNLRVAATRCIECTSNKPDRTALVGFRRCAIVQRVAAARHRVSPDSTRREKGPAMPAGLSARRWMVCALPRRLLRSMRR